LSILVLAVYTLYLRIAVSEKEFYHCWIKESMYLLFLVAILAYVGVHIYFFIVIIELYLEIKAAEPTPVPEDAEAKITKEEELQLLETPKVENSDETDKVDEKPAEDEKKEEAEKKEKKNRCAKLNCAKDIFKCPSIGNCIGPDHFE
jgi:flagellar biosynthesis/type III secretory pathway M-ring protein FliF/YscJ